MEQAVTAPVVNSMFAQFQTDKELEKNGVRVDYGDFYFIVARSGGANQAYTNRAKVLFKPHRRAIQTDTMSDDLADKLDMQAHCEMVIKGAGSTQYGDGFLVGEDGKALQVTPENLMKVFQSLPDLWADVRAQAKSVALFRKEVQEADAKN